MGCESWGVVTKVLIDLREIGIVGLRTAFRHAEESGITEREALLNLIIEILARENYIPEWQTSLYRLAVWREYLRVKGRDFREFFSPVDVVVRGNAGDERDRFVETLSSVFAHFELKPVIAFEPPDAEGRHPRLLIEDETIVEGLLPPRAFKRAVQKRISHW